MEIMTSYCSANGCCPTEAENVVALSIMVCAPSSIENVRFLTRRPKTDRVRVDAVVRAATERCCVYVSVHAGMVCSGSSSPGDGIVCSKLCQAAVAHRGVSSSQRV